MSDWQWFIDFSAEAFQRGDKTPSELLNLHNDAFTARETNPKRTLALFAEARCLAESYGHPWWVMLFEQWHVHGTIFYERDFCNLLTAAVRNVLKMRLATFADYPQRLWVICDLINIYQNIDPLGYEQETREVIAYLEGELHLLRSETRYQVQENKIDLVLADDRLTEAADLAWSMLGQLDADMDRHVAEHYRLSALLYLCGVACEKRDWGALAEVAAELETGASQRGVMGAQASALMWLATTARHAGDRALSGRRYRAARARRARLAPHVGWCWHQALAAYHDVAGNLAKTLQAREEEFNTIRDRGQLAYECDCLIERCRLLVLLGKLKEEDLRAARAAMQPLRKPAKYLEALELAMKGEKRVR